MPPDTCPRASSGRLWSPRCARRRDCGGHTAPRPKPRLPPSVRPAKGAGNLHVRRQGLRQKAACRVSNDCQSIPRPYSIPWPELGARTRTRHPVTAEAAPSPGELPRAWALHPALAVASGVSFRSLQYRDAVYCRELYRPRINYRLSQRPLLSAIHTCICDGF
jgi:hypothetical protein